MKTVDYVKKCSILDVSVVVDTAMNRVKISTLFTTSLALAVPSIIDDFFYIDNGL